MHPPSLPVVHLRPGRRWLRIDWRELWTHRDLVRMLIARDYSSRFRQTILGPLWYVGQPLLVTVVMTVVFNRLLNVTTDGIPALLFYLSGLVVWNYHAQTLAFAGNIFHANSSIVTKVYFPRLALPLASCASGLVGFAVQLGTFGVFLIIHWIRHGLPDLGAAHWAAVAIILPLIAVQSLLVALGSCLWLSAVTAKYRDFQHVLPLLTQVWLYLTPVVYPLVQVPEQWRWLAQLNPLVLPVELTRWCFFTTGEFSTLAVAASVSGTLLLVFSGLFAFQRVETAYADLN